MHLLLSFLLATAMPSVHPQPGLHAAISTSIHSAVLSWTASPDGGTVNVYRASGSCGSGTSFSELATGQAAGGSYTDSTITVGSWCYYVTAVVGGAESGASNQAGLSVSPQPPQGLTAKGQ